MCEFFSFITNGKGRVYYFDKDQREGMAGEPDSHSYIAYFNELNVDKVNKYEYVNDKLIVDQINTRDDSKYIRDTWLPKFIKSKDWKKLDTRPKLYKKYLAMIMDISKVWTEQEIKNLKRACGYCSTLPRGYRDALVEQANLLLDNAITPKQTAIGIEFLKRKAFKLNGKPRQTKNYPFSDRELYIIRNFSHFKFRGFHYEYYYQRVIIGPIYRVCSTTGDHFDYVGGRKVIILA